MFKSGESVYIENRLEQEDGRGPDGTFERPELASRGTRILKLNVQETVEDPSEIPDVLRPFAPIRESELAAARIRRFELGRRHGMWTINDQLVDLDRPMATPRINAPEIWRLKNNSGGWWHPVHIHSEYCRVISRNGRRPSPFLAEQDGIAKKDTVVLGPNSEVEVFVKFRDFCGPWVFHCHNIEHEDLAMMARFDVMPMDGVPYF
jgi:FtsP/CotA-like multicopper oxidase with cupredoxin domain